MSKSVKKQVDDARDNKHQDLDLSDKSISKLHDIPELCKYYSTVPLIYYDVV